MCFATDLVLLLLLPSQWLLQIPVLCLLWALMFIHHCPSLLPSFLHIDLMYCCWHADDCCCCCCSAGSLFGGSSAPAFGSTGTGLFGSTAAPAPAQGSTLFGGTGAFGAAPGTAGSSLFGAPQNPAGQGLAAPGATGFSFGPPPAAAAAAAAVPPATVGQQPYGALQPLPQVNVLEHKVRPFVSLSVVSAGVPDESGKRLMSA